MKLCAACHQDLPKDKFSKKQWKLGAECQRRCTSCVRDNREVVQPPPPPVDENNTGIVSLLDSMSFNDNVTPLSDEELFKQPPQKEDCPICFLRIPSLEGGERYFSCCGKIICSGCVYANAKFTIHGSNGILSLSEEHQCPFCRTPMQESDKELRKRLQTRVEMNDPRAMLNLGCGYDQGIYGCPRNHHKALELWHRAGELGYAQAYNNIGTSFCKGEGVERDMKKAMYYLGLAAICGDVESRFNLGFLETQEGNMDRALRHYMIAVESGDTYSLKKIKQLFTDGHATKDDYTKALRMHQAYLDEIRSDPRDKVAALDEQYKYY